MTFVSHSSERQAKVHDVAGDDFRSSVLQSIKSWIQVCGAYRISSHHGTDAN